jgi:aminoglycoside 3-N-acetyltransferase
VHLWLRTQLARQLTDLGLAAGDPVLVHAALRSVGPVLGGPDVLIAALGDAVGPGGTLLAYCDWQLDDAPPELREEVPPFDPARSRSIRDNGAFPELLRTTPGARRSANPGASFAALGARAEWFTTDHPLDYGYGPGSPLGKLVEARGKTLLLGAPKETMTLLHHAEHVARVPGKRVLRYEAPILVEGKKTWRRFEEFDTGNPVVAGLEDDYFTTVVEDFLASGHGAQGLVGAAPCVLVDAKAMVDFAVAWLEARFPWP